jgi:uncharacterized protein YbjT (DUF2867 family)
MAEAQRTTTLVLAGTGKTGRRVVARLRTRNAPVRVGSRKGQPPFDWHDDATWAPALDDVGAVYVAYYPDAGFPGAAAVIGSFADLAARIGVRRLVLLADRGAAEAERAEQATRGCGVAWTVVRAGFIAQNFSEEFLADAIRAGVVALPAADVMEPFTDAEDIADVAAAALTEDGHAEKIYELTGPRLLTFADAVGEIAKETGREIHYLPVSPQHFAAALTEQGAPATYASQMADLMAEVFDGRRAHLTDDFRRAIGQEPRDFTDYVRDAAATGVWNTR